MQQRRFSLPGLMRPVILLSILLLTALSANQAQSSTELRANHVIVKKSARTLYLFQDQKLLKTFPVSLGKNPIGHKLYQGDRRTPEGRYQLDWRNANSKFYRSIHISYPNLTDRRQANQKGVNPGGSIMIHGLPNKYADGAEVMLDLNWTDGCIAVSNRAIEEIWQLVADNTTIDIIP